VRSSVSRLLLQVVVGRPCLRFPWGFQSSACLVMLVGTRLRVCPIHRHFRSLMVSGIGLCCVLLQSSSLEIVSGHLIRRICRRQVFTKTWSFETSPLVCVHVSEPYNKTYFYGQALFLLTPVLNAGTDKCLNSIILSHIYHFLTYLSVIYV